MGGGGGGGGRQKNSIQGFGKSRLGFGSTQAFGKFPPVFWKTTKFARAVGLYFLV